MAERTEACHRPRQTRGLHWRFGDAIYQDKCRGLGDEHIHIKETCDDVAEDFQPYARAIINLGDVRWGSDKFMKDEFLG